MKETFINYLRGLGIVVIFAGLFFIYFTTIIDIGAAPRVRHEKEAGRDTLDRLVIP